MQNDKYKGLAEAIEKCEKELPDDYTVSMHTVENGPTLVKLFCGEVMVWDDSSYLNSSIAERYLMALQWAKYEEAYCKMVKYYESLLTGRIERRKVEKIEHS